MSEFFPQFLKTFSYFGKYVLHRLPYSGKSQGILLLLILDLHMFKTNQFGNMKWWFFIMWLGASNHLCSLLEHSRHCSRYRDVVLNKTGDTYAYFALILHSGDGGKKQTPYGLKLWQIWWGKLSGWLMKTIRRESQVTWKGLSEQMVFGQLRLRSSQEREPWKECSWKRE